MFIVEVNFPPNQNLKCSSCSSLFKKKYRSLRHASLELKVSYYFLYNCYHRQHNNQFTSFFNIYRVDDKGNKLQYKPPKKKKRKNPHDLKQLRKPLNNFKPNKKCKKTKTKTKTKIQVKGKGKGKGKRLELQYEWISGKINSEEHNTQQHVPQKTRCNQWKLWSFNS